MSARTIDGRRKDDIPSDIFRRGRSGTVGVTALRPARTSTMRVVVPALLALTLCLALAGVAIATGIVSGGADGAAGSDGRVPTSFGALWVESSHQITLPQTDNKDNFGMPIMGAPDKVMLEVTVRLANTDTAPVDVTPDRFSLRLGPGTAPIAVEGARFESVRLLPAAVFDARVQFPVTGGDYQPTLLFEDPGRSEPIALELNRTRFQQPAGNQHQHH